MVMKKQKKSSDNMLNSNKLSQKTNTKYAVKKMIDEISLWGGRRPLLKQLDMELTERCNNNCIHCYINLPANDQKVKGRELSTYEIKEILIEAASLGCLKVRFTGGEPLLREDFEEIYIFARKLGLKVVIFTNGTLITQKIADLFSKIPPLERIEISIYSMKKKSYEAITRVSGSFKAAMRGIVLLLERNIPFIVKGVLLPQNKNEIEEFERWASAIPWMVTFPSYSMILQFRCRRDSEEKNRIIKRLRPSPAEVLEMLTRKREEYTKEMDEFCPKFMSSSEGDKLFNCGAGMGGCVDAYGYFQPCVMLRHPDTVYDLKDGSVKDAVSRFFPDLRKMKAVNSSYISRCSKCILKGLCEQCPATSWMEHGVLDKPVEYLCEIAHLQAGYLGILKDGEKGWRTED